MISGQGSTYVLVDPRILQLLVFIAAVLVLVLLFVVLDLIVDWRAAKPHRRRTLLAALVDEGIALAERTKGPSDLKLRNAVDWAEARAQDHKLKTTRNELAKLVEIRLPRKSV